MLADSALNHQFDLFSIHKDGETVASIRHKPVEVCARIPFHFRFNLVGDTFSDDNWPFVGAVCSSADQSNEAFRKNHAVTTHVSGWCIMIAF